MTDIMLNGQAREVDVGSTLIDLLRAEGLGERKLAVEINLDIVPRAEHSTRVLRDGDRIEIVHAIGGG